MPPCCAYTQPLLSPATIRPFDRWGRWGSERSGSRPGSHGWWVEGWGSLSRALGLLGDPGSQQHLSRPCREVLSCWSCRFLSPQGLFTREPAPQRLVRPHSTPEAGALTRFLSEDRPQLLGLGRGSERGSLLPIGIWRNPTAWGGQAHSREAQEWARPLSQLVPSLAKVPGQSFLGSKSQLTHPQIGSQYFLYRSAEGKTKNGLK